MKLSAEDKIKVDELIEICKKYQGEYIPGGHGPGSWATTYSNEFIAAAAKMFLIFKKARYGVWTDAIYDLADSFKDAGIRSCRGSTMNFDRVNYLYETHLEEKIKSLVKTSG